MMSNVKESKAFLEAKLAGFKPEVALRSRRIEERACADVFSAVGLDWTSDLTGAWYSLIGKDDVVSATALQQNWQAEMLGFHTYGALARQEPDPERKRLAFTGMRIEPVTPYTWF